MPNKNLKMPENIDLNEGYDPDQTWDVWIIRIFSLAGIIGSLVVLYRLIYD